MMGTAINVPSPQVAIHLQEIGGCVQIRIRLICLLRARAPCGPEAAGYERRDRLLVLRRNLEALRATLD